MEYSMKPYEIGGHLVETGATNGDGRIGDGNSCYSSLLGNPRTKRIGQAVNSPFLVTMSHHMLPSSQQADHGSGRSKSHATFNILRNLITCSAVKINDSVILLRHSCIKKTTLSNAGLEICKEGKQGGTARSLGDPWEQHQHHTARNSFDGVKDFRKKTDNTEFPNLKPVPAAYRPASIPTCSLCSKGFKPEKLHSHMKSCRGMKMLAKNTVTATGAQDKESSWRSATTSKDSVRDHTGLLCQ